MYVTDLEITDLRSFRGTQSISLDRGDGSYAGWTVFAGRNGSGKSTLLKAIALSIIGPQSALSLAGVFTDWVRHGAEEARVATRLVIDEARDETAGNEVSTIRTGLQWGADPREKIASTHGSRMRATRRMTLSGPARGSTLPKDGL